MRNATPKHPPSQTSKLRSGVQKSPHFSSLEKIEELRVKLQLQKNENREILARVDALKEFLRRKGVEFTLRKMRIKPEDEFEDPDKKNLIFEKKNRQLLPDNRNEYLSKAFTFAVNQLKSAQLEHSDLKNTFHDMLRQLAQVHTDPNELNQFFLGEMGFFSQRDKSFSFEASGDVSPSDPKGREGDRSFKSQSPKSVNKHREHHNINLSHNNSHSLSNHLHNDSYNNAKIRNQNRRSPTKNDPIESISPEEPSSSKPYSPRYLPSLTSPAQQTTFNAIALSPKNRHLFSHPQEKSPDHQRPADPKVESSNFVARPLKKDNFPLSSSNFVKDGFSHSGNLSHLGGAGLVPSPTVRPVEHQSKFLDDSKFFIFNNSIDSKEEEIIPKKIEQPSQEIVPIKQDLISETVSNENLSQFYPRADPSPKIPKIISEENTKASIVPTKTTENLNLFLQTENEKQSDYKRSQTNEFNLPVISNSPPKLENLLPLVFIPKEESKLIISPKKPDLFGKNSINFSEEVRNSEDFEPTSLKSLEQFFGSEVQSLEQASNDVARQIFENVIKKIQRPPKNAKSFNNLTSPSIKPKDREERTFTLSPIVQPLVKKPTITQKNTAENPHIWIINNRKKHFLEKDIEEPLSSTRNSLDNMLPARMKAPVMKAMTNSLARLSKKTNRLSPLRINNPENEIMLQGKNDKGVEPSSPTTPINFFMGGRQGFEKALRFSPSKNRNSSTVPSQNNLPSHSEIKEIPYEESQTQSQSQSANVDSQPPLELMTKNEIDRLIEETFKTQRGMFYPHGSDAKNPYIDLPEIRRSTNESKHIGAITVLSQGGKKRNDFTSSPRDAHIMKVADMFKHKNSDLFERKTSKPTKKPNKEENSVENRKRESKMRVDEIFFDIGSFRDLRKGRK